MILIFTDVIFIPVLVSTQRAAEANNMATFGSLLFASAVLVLVALWLAVTTPGFRVLRATNLGIIGGLLALIAYEAIRYSLGRD
jgi:hypothetical protein